MDIFQSHAFASLKDLDHRLVFVYFNDTAQLPFVPVDRHLHDLVVSRTGNTLQHYHGAVDRTQT